MTKEGDNSAGIAGLIFGLLSIVFGISLVLILGPIGGIILGILGLIFSIVQMKISNNKWAIWGFILSIFGLVLNIIILIYAINLISQAASQYNELLASGALSNPAALPGLQ